MSPTRTLVIADDEPLARERVRRFLLQESDFRLVGEAGNGAEATALIRDQQPDVAVLDVRLPDLDGFTVIDTLNLRRPPAVIFMTAVGDHSIRAYHAGAADFLVKPFDRARFRAALDRVRAGLESERLLPAGDALPGRIAVRCGRRFVFVNFSDLDAVEADDSASLFHTQHGTVTVNEGFGSVIRRLPPAHFVAVNRSAAVNLERIAWIEPQSHGDMRVRLQRGLEYTLTRTHRAQVLALLKRS